MGGRVVAVDAAAEHGDRVAVCLECAAVRLPVHPTREPAHDDDACLRELAAEHPRNLCAVRRAGSRAHDRDGRARKQLGISDPAHVQPSRRIVNRPQERRQLISAEECH